MASRLPLNILIVEDEALLAMELESLIEDCGHKVVGWATSADSAVEMIDTVPADLAFVDVQLQNGTSGIDVARYISQHNPLMVVFLTANPKQLPEDFAGAGGVIPKPYTINGLVRSLAYIEQGIRNPPPSLPRPNALTLAPPYRTAWAPPDRR